VVLVGLEEHPVARADDLDGAVLALAHAEALGDEDGLAVRMCQAVRARGVRCTAAAANVDVASGAAAASM
jgi:hypothetical protein